MTGPRPHFDALSLLEQVHQQDVGLIVSTNNPRGFLRVVYAAGRTQPTLRCSIYAAPDSKQKFWLLKKPHASLPPLSEDTSDAS